MKRVLFVEDHADTRDLIKAMLKGSSFEVYYCECPTKALEEITESFRDSKPYDLIVTDLVFANDNLVGTELAEAIRNMEDERGLDPSKIVFFTGYAESTLGIAKNHLDVLAVWRKPEDVQSIRAKIEDILAMPGKNRRTTTLEPGPIVQYRDPKSLHYIWTLLILSLGLTIVSFFLSTRSRSKISEIHDMLQNAGLKSSVGTQFTAVQPTGQFADKTLASGRERVTLELMPDEAAKVKSVLKERNKLYDFTISEKK